MRQEKRKELWDMLPSAIAIIIVYGLFGVLGIGCPIKFVTGISCLGCGMTRAWMSVLRLDIKSAFYYHPAFWLPPIVLLLLYFKYKINIKYYKFFMFTAIGCFVIIYLVRLIWFNDNIVVFQPENSIISKIIQKFIL